MNALALQSQAPHAVNNILEGLFDEEQPLEIQINAWDYFSLKQAIKGFYQELYLMGSYDTQERHTYVAYSRDLRCFLEFIRARSYDALPSYDERIDELSAFQFPTEQEVFENQEITTPAALLFPDRPLIDEYIVYLRGQGIINRTINRYMYPVKLFCKKLIEAKIKRKIMVMGNQVQANLLSQIYARLDEVKDELHLITKLKGQKVRISRGKKADKWISEADTRKILGSIKREKLSGKRDYALFMLGFHSGLRLAEICRLSLSCFERATSTTYAVYVTGKGSKDDPIGCDIKAYRAILEWVAAWNKTIMVEWDAARMDEYTDPRLITSATPLWRRVRAGDIIPAGQDAERAITNRAVGKMVSTRSAAAGVQISPHWMRHSLAANALEHNMPMHEVKDQLRHTSIATTIDTYAKKSVVDWDARNPSTYGYLSDLDEVEQE